MDNAIHFQSMRRITFTLVLRSGLHIGAGKDAVEIGGIDSPVVRDPLTHEPYVPGSSLKGKLRSLLEWALDCIEPDGKVWGSGRGHYEPDDPILRVFGTTAKGWRGGPTRLLVRDAYLDREWLRKVRDQGLAYTEDKTEVSIDRIQGKAAKMGPRHMERVAAGARFQVEMGFRVFSIDGDGGATDQTCLNRLLEGLRLLEGDALGGSGSRGYGRVAIEELRIDGEDIQASFEAVSEIRRAAPSPIAAASEAPTGD